MNNEYDLNAKQIQIKRFLDKLDQVAIKKEAAWGIGRLPNLVSPEMRIKWDAQQERLRAALESQNLSYVQDIVEGTIRGWDVLEAEAIKLGHKPNDNEYWEATFEGSEFVYRIFKTEIEKRNLHPEDGYVHYSLTEVARMLEDYQLVNRVQEKFGGTVRALKRDKTKKHVLEDDEIPW